MTRDEVLRSIREKVKNDNLVRHMLATEAIMRALAVRFGGDVEEWGLAGLLHDIDVELVGGDMNQHSRLGAEMARQLGASEAIAQAILTHNEAHRIPARTDLDKALFCADPLTGLITAAALVRPDRKLQGVEGKSVRRRFKEKSFAAGANRENIASCASLGIGLDDFVDLALKAMQDVAPELGL
jgi:putative nucleotidyltransferase with HDIG domain